MPPQIPDFLTHYFRERPFRSLTELTPEATDEVLVGLSQTRQLPRRLRTPTYFVNRRRVEELMYGQFVAKGGRPERRHPHYAILGESEIWAGIEPRWVRFSLSEIPADQISFTYTDSMVAFVDVDLSGNPVPRKPAYGSVYRLDELAAIFDRFGWPGDRWKTEPDWQHDCYVEAQIWSDEPLEPYLTPNIASHRNDSKETS